VFSGDLLRIPKKKIKDKINIKKINFYTFSNVLNAHISRQNLLTHCLTSGRRYCLAFSLSYYSLKSSK
jgi:hypothetical protein